MNCAKLAIQQVCIMCPNDSKAQRAKDVPRMRICFVSPYPPRFGGIATYTHELIAGIKERGHAVYVICYPDLNAGGACGTGKRFCCDGYTGSGLASGRFRRHQQANPRRCTYSTRIRSLRYRRKT